MSQYSAIWNPITKRWITKNSKTHRKLMQEGHLPVFEDNDIILEYIRNKSADDVDGLKSFYKQCPDLPFTAVRGRGCYTDYLVKRMKHREGEEEEHVENQNNNEFVL